MTSGENADIAQAIFGSNRSDVIYSSFGTNFGIPFDQRLDTNIVIKNQSQLKALDFIQRIVKKG